MKCAMRNVESSNEKVVISYDPINAMNKQNHKSLSKICNIIRFSLGGDQNSQSPHNDDVKNMK